MLISYVFSLQEVMLTLEVEGLCGVGSIRDGEDGYVRGVVVWERRGETERDEERGGSKDRRKRGVEESEG